MARRNTAAGIAQKYAMAFRVMTVSLWRLKESGHLLGDHEDRALLRGGRHAAVRPFRRRWTDRQDLVTVRKRDLEDLLAGLAGQAVGLRVELHGIGRRALAG